MATESTTTKASTSETDIEAMRAAVEKHDAEQAEKAEAEATAALKPLDDFLKAEDLDGLAERVEDVRLKVAAYPQVNSMLDAIKRTIEALPRALDRAKAQARTEYAKGKEAGQ